MLPGDGGQVRHGDGAHVLAQRGRQGVVVAQGDPGYEAAGSRRPQTCLLPRSCGARGPSTRCPDTRCADGLGETGADGGDGPEYPARWAKDGQTGALGDDGRLGTSRFGGAQARAHTDAGPHGQAQPLCVAQDGGAQGGGPRVHLLDVESGDDQGGAAGG